MRHPRDRANGTGDARIVSRVFSNPRAGCSKSNMTFQGVEREPDACFNSLYTSGECCLGACRAPRGHCIGGVCECHASFAGFDCSDHSADGHPAGFIYVHAPPPKLGLHNALRFQCHRNTYDSDWHFLRRLLADPLARSPSIDAATLFYVPVWAAASWGNIAAAKFGWSAHRALEWVGTRHRAHWEANASRYLMYFTADKGACRVPRWGQINMVHLGLTTPFQFQVHPGDWKYNASATVPCPPVTRQSIRCPQEPACFTEGHDFAMPFYIAWNPEANVPPRELLALQHENRWECELYFAGSLQHGRFSPFYAQQVRQQVHDHHVNRTGYCILERAPDDLWYKSRFCLAPMGDGFGDRLQRAMRTGCVPLIVMPAVVQPLEDILPYDEFSLRIRSHDAIPTLHRTLAAVGAREHARLRQGVRRWAHAFNWHDEKGSAYEYIRYALCLRSGSAACAALQPAALEQRGV